MAKKTSSNKDNLTKVKGIGPKIQSILNAAGITTYAQLASSKKADIQKILEAAGNRYRSYDSAPWIKEAKTFAKKSKPTTPPKETKPKAKPKTKVTPKAKPKPKQKPKVTPKPKAKKKPVVTPKPKPKRKPKPKPSKSEQVAALEPNEIDLPRVGKIMRELKGNVEGLTNMTVRKYRKEAKRDAERLLKKMRKNLRRWTKLLERGDLSTQDFEFLVQSNVASAKMSALEQSGLAAIRLQAYRTSIFNMIVDTIFDIILRVLK